MPDQETHTRSVQGALTYPVAAPPSGGESRVTESTRNIRDLQGLLRFATELTRNEDAAGPSVLLPIDDERRKFLEDAINSLTVDTTTEMQVAINILGNRDVILAINCDAQVPDDVMQAFDTLMDLVINMDFAIGFYKMDGYKIFPVILSCENVEVRSQACQLLAEICQNNPFCQSKALESGFVHTVLNILKGEDNKRVLKSALYAISCLVREHDQCAKTFLSEGGCDCLISCVQRPVEALRNKAAFIICHTYAKYPQMKEKATDFIRALTVGLKDNIEDNPGCLLSALRAIITPLEEDENETVLSQCSHKDVAELKETVEKHMRHCLADVSAYMEEIDHCKDILKCVNKMLKKQTNTIDTGSVDR